MRVPVWRSCLLFLCTVSAFVALGRAPGAVNLRLRDIETTLTAEGKSGRDKRAALPWPGAGKSGVRSPHSVADGAGLVYNATMELIIDTAALAAACTRFAEGPFVTVDTEFMRETTYYSKLCLIQMAGPDQEGVLVDPLAPGLDLQPFLDLMTDPRVIKVFHSGRQDVEIVWNMGEVIPVPLFDTQVAAMVCGYGDSVSYEQLANDLAKARIDKSSRFTDWSRRPLSEAQTAYALSDVTHLVAVYERLRDQLERTGRSAWLDDEMAVLTSPATYRNEPELAWTRLSGRMRKPREIAILREVAAWREREAQSRDVPRGRVLKDEAVIDVAVSSPRSVEALGRLRSIPNGFERSRTGGDILAAVERGIAREADESAVSHRSRGRGGGATVELLKVLLRAIAENEGVAPKLIASVDDLEAIAESDGAEVGALSGWRRGLFGEKALALKAGAVGLSIERGRVVTFPRERE